jgi:hypothetical protein
MRPRHAQLSLQRMLVIVGIIALLLPVFVGARRRFKPTPAEWAWDLAESQEQDARNYLGLIEEKPSGISQKSLRDHVESSLRMAEWYRRLARTYTREGANWAEDVVFAPYEDKLARGVSVASMLDVSVPSTQEGDPPGVGGARAIPARTVLSVVNDPAWQLVDNDLVLSNRSIEVQILDGPHAGKIITIARAFLRRVRR